ncbi:MAG: hypothetical protein KY456_16980, partial [Chloroflexi bacterium]|nr:hypothetical protein [Chloroflexota bacterium]
VLLVLPFAALYAPQFQVSGPSPLAQMSGVAPLAADGVTSIFPGVDRAGEAPAQAQGLHVPEYREPGTVSSGGQAAALIYLFPMLFLGVLTIVAVTRLSNVRSRARVVEDPEWLSAFAQVQRQMRWKHGAALLVSAELSSPVSWGMLRPVIMIDERSLGSAGQARAIIAHELAHVARLDWAKLILARACTALYWFNPFVWILAASCHQLREEAVDDAVLRSEVMDVDYAEILIGSARRFSQGGLLAMNIAAPRRTSLKRRVKRVLDSSLRRTPVNFAWSAPCGVSATLVAGLVAALTPVEGSTQTEFTPAPLTRFKSVELHGDGTVILRHGRTQQVLLKEGIPGSTHLSVGSEGILTIKACASRCSTAAPAIEIVTPSIEMAAVTGRGLIRIDGEFPESKSLALAATDDGTIDARSTNVLDVAVAVTNGGLVSVSAQRELAASVTGGGKIQYCDGPASVASTITSGGSVEKLAESAAGC